MGSTTSLTAFPTLSFTSSVLETYQDMQGKSQDTHQDKLTIIRTCGERFRTHQDMQTIIRTCRVRTCRVRTHIRTCRQSSRHVGKESGHTSGYTDNHQDMQERVRTHIRTRRVTHIRTGELLTIFAAKFTNSCSGIRTGVETQGKLTREGGSLSTIQQT